MRKKGLMSVMSVQQAESKEIQRLGKILKILSFIIKAPFLAFFYIGQGAEWVIDKLEDIEQDIPYRYIRLTKLPLSGKRKG